MSNGSRFRFKKTLLLQVLKIQMYTNLHMWVHTNIHIGGDSITFLKGPFIIFYKRVIFV